MEIKNSYLMWVGKEHYPTIQDFVKEAAAQGISKRLPNTMVAEKLLEEGTVVFVVHDEGEYHECPDCFGTIECPECRKRTVTMGRLIRESEKLESERKQAVDDLADAKYGNIQKEVERLEKLIGSIELRISNRHKAQKELNDAKHNCMDCQGSNRMEAGTGGYVIFKDGSKMDYRRYNYWLHQPKIWSADDNQGGIHEKKMCETCGGTGRLPDGKVFGMFVPAGLEYILKPEDTVTVEEEMKAKAIETITAAAVEKELPRGCGKRKPGGIYVVTHTNVQSNEKTQEDIKTVIDRLVKLGTIDPKGADITGNFAEFVAPVEIDSVKRFRGIKRWSLDPRAEQEAEMITDAMAAD